MQRPSPYGAPPQQLAAGGVGRGAATQAGGTTAMATVGGGGGFGLLPARAPMPQAVGTVPMSGGVGRGCTSSAVAADRHNVQPQLHAFGTLAPTDPSGARGDDFGTPADGGGFDTGRKGGVDDVAQEGDDPDKPKIVTYVPPATDMAALMADKVEVGLHFEHITEEQVDRAGDNVDAMPVFESFADAGLSPAVLSNMTALGYAAPTPVQRHVVPMLQAGIDVLASAQTGSGKTAAFLVPIISQLLQKEDIAESSSCSPRALVIAPTRELVLQIANEARKFAHGTVVRCAELYGGVRVSHQAERCDGATVLVSTIGRLKHFLQLGIVALGSCRYLVIDEVDRMLLNDDQQSVDTELCELIDQRCTAAGLRPAGERHTAMFSATMSSVVKSLAARFTAHACTVAVGLVGAANRDIVQTVLPVTRFEKKDKLLQMLKEEKEEAERGGASLCRTLVFVNTKKATDVLAMILSDKAFGIRSISIHGDRDQCQRETALSALRTGACHVLVATAVCERGLDIKGVDHVVNYDLPDDIGQYVHRIGRTGRVGRRGTATSFYEAGRDDRLVLPLVKVLTDAGQPVPDFLNELAKDAVEVDGDGFNADGGGADDDW